MRPFSITTITRWAKLFFLIALVKSENVCSEDDFYERAFDELLQTLRNPQDRIVAKVETIDVAIPVAWKPHEKYYKLVKQILAKSETIPKKLLQAFHYLQQQQNERPALLKIFTGLGGHNNLAQQWTDKDYCQWKGITCNKEKLVTRLELPSMQLGGTLPTELQVLHHLKVLILTNNQLRGPIPVRHVPVLFLDQNQLNGTIPESVHAREWSLSENL